MKIDLQHIKRVLIIQIRPFGDVLLNTGYLPHLRQRLPHAEIDFLVKAPYRHILEDNPHIDNCVVFGEKGSRPIWLDKLGLFARVRKRRYDLIIDQLQGTTSAQIVFFSRARYRIATTEVRWRWFYNIRVPYQGKRYSASMKFDLLQPLGIEESPYRLEYKVRPGSSAYVNKWLQKNELDRRPFILLSPGSPRERKKWDARCYARLADLIVEHLDRQVVLLWGPDEKQAVEQVLNFMERRPLLAPPTDFNQAAAMLKACQLLVCNDGGLNHLSVATRTPSLAIFGSTSPVTWSPASVFPLHHHLHHPQGENPNDNTFGITPAEAFEKVCSIIQ